MFPLFLTGRKIFPAVNHLLINSKISLFRMLYANSNLIIFFIIYLILLSTGNSLGKGSPPLIYFFIISKLTRQKNVTTCFLSFASTIESVKPSSLTFWTCSAEYFLLIKTRSSYRNSRMWKSNQLVFSAQLDWAERLKVMCV